MTATGLQSMVHAVERVEDILTGPGTQQLLLLKGSKQYAARLAQQLSIKAGQEGKCLKCVCVWMHAPSVAVCTHLRSHRLANETEAKRLATQRALMADAPQLQRLGACARGAKSAVETGLSKALGGRIVHVTGGDLFAGSA